MDWTEIEFKVRTLVRELVEPTASRVFHIRQEFDLLKSVCEGEVERTDLMQIQIEKHKKKLGVFDGFQKRLVEVSSQQKVLDAKLEREKQRLNSLLDGLKVQVQNTADKFSVFQNQKEHLRTEISKQNFEVSRMKGIVQEKVKDFKENFKEKTLEIQSLCQKLQVKVTESEKTLKTTNQLMQNIEVSSSRAERQTEENTEEIKGFRQKIKTLIGSLDNRFENVRENVLKQAAFAKEDVEKLASLVHGEVMVEMELQFFDVLHLVTLDRKLIRKLAQVESEKIETWTQKASSLSQRIENSKIRAGQILNQVKKTRKNTFEIDSQPIVKSRTVKSSLKEDIRQEQGKHIGKKKHDRQPNRNTIVENQKIPHAVTLKAPLKSQDKKIPRKTKKQTVLELLKAPVQRKSIIKSQNKIKQPVLPVKVNESQQEKISSIKKVKPSQRVQNKSSFISQVKPESMTEKPQEVQQKFQQKRIESQKQYPKDHLKINHPIMQPISQFKLQNTEFFPPISQNQQTSQNILKKHNIQTQLQHLPEQNTQLYQQNPLFSQLNLPQNPHITQNTPQQNQQQLQFSTIVNINPIETSSSESSISLPSDHSSVQQFDGDTLDQVLDHLKMLTQRFNQFQKQTTKQQIKQKNTQITHTSKLDTKLNALIERTHNQVQLNKNNNTHQDFLIKRLQMWLSSLTNEFKKFVFQTNRNFQTVNCHLQKCLEQYTLSASQRKRDLTDIYSQFKTVFDKISSLNSAKDSLQQKTASLKKAQNSIIELFKIQISLDSQDQLDRDSIILMGYSQHTTDSKFHKRVVSYDKQCLSCSNQTALSLRAFKLACLTYTPSNVIYNNTPFTRKQLIQSQQKIVDSLTNSSIKRLNLSCITPKQGRSRTTVLSHRVPQKSPRAELNVPEEFPRLTSRRPLSMNERNLRLQLVIPWLRTVFFWRCKNRSVRSASTKGGRYRQGLPLASMAKSSPRFVGRIRGRQRHQQLKKIWTLK